LKFMAKTARNLIKSVDLTAKSPLPHHHTCVKLM
jgi:hypothetical protein